MPIPTLQLIVSAVGLLVTAGGLAFLALEVRHLKLSVRSAAHAAIYERAYEFRSHLMTYPELRPYFFAGEAVDRNSPDGARVLTLGEIYLNYLENVMVTYDGLGEGNWPSLDRFLAASFRTAPVLAEIVGECPERYAQVMVEYASGVAATPQDMPGSGSP